MDLLKKIMIVLLAIPMLWNCSDDDESTNEGDPTISLSTNIIQVNKNGGDATVSVTSSGDWQMSGVCDWAHPSATFGKNGDVVTFTIDPSTIDEERIVTFKFFTGSAVASLQIKSDPNDVMELLTDETILLSKEKSTIEIQLSTNIAAPTITCSEGSEKWLKFDKRCDFGGKIYFMFIASENETYKVRNATITISSPLVEKPIKVIVNQEKKNAILSDQSTLMYNLEGRTISFNVKYNVENEIYITQGNEWITNQSVSEPQTDNDGLSTVTLTYDLSAASTPRGGIIHIVSKTDDTTSCDIVVIQKNPEDKLGEIPDDNLRTFCIKNGWVNSIAGSQCVILDAGQKATTLSYNDYFNELKDLTGIDNFPNLESLNLGFCTSMKKLDISGLHKVKDLTFSGAKVCEEYNFGDNPIVDFYPGGGARTAVSAENLKIITSVMESLTLSYWGNKDNDKVTSIDVSECPALKELDANRTDRLKTLYLKEGQVIPVIDCETATIIYK